MPFRPRAGSQTFTNDWNQTVAWAQGQGIDPASYMPVYQLDLNRFQAGEHAMGRAERNLAILAAHNPRQVTSVPSDNPNPTSVFGNVVADAGKVATGLAGIFTGSFEKQVWHSAQATIRGIEHPASLRGRTPGGTVANWLNDTLLSFVPGAADIGTVLKADPTLSGSAGLKALFQHPLISALDLLPGGEGMIARGARYAGAVELAARLNGYSEAELADGAAKAGLSVQDYAKTLKGRSMVGHLAQRIGAVRWGGKSGMTLKGEWADKLSVSERLQKLAARTPGVGPAVSDLIAHFEQAQAYDEHQWTWLLGTFADNLNTLIDKDPAAARTVFRVLHGKDLTAGDSVVRAMGDPNLSPLAKEVIRQALHIGRFDSDESVIKGGLAGVVDNSGHLGFWSRSGPHADVVLGAKKEMDAQRARALEAIGTLEPLANRLEGLHAALPSLLGALQKRTVAARRRIFDDPRFQTELRQAGGKATLRKVTELRAVFDQGGLIDDAMATATEHPAPADVLAVAQALQRRLSAWGPRSVKAADAPEMAAVHQVAGALESWAKATQKTEAEIDRHIRGEVEATKAHAAQRREYNDARMRTQKEQHALERLALRDKRDAAKKARSGAVALWIAQRHAETLQLIGEIQRQTEMAEPRLAGESERAWSARIDALVKNESKRIRNLNRAMESGIKARTKWMKDENRLEQRTYERDAARMSKTHGEAKALLRREVAKERLGYGSMVREMDVYGKAINRFHQAVIDHPADIYRNPFLELYRRNLRSLEDTAAAKIATETFLSAKEKDASTRAEIEKIRNNPDYLVEYMALHWDEIMGQPNLDPELRQFAEAEKREAYESAKEELKLLIGQGYKVPYIPTASAFDVGMGRHSLFPLIGRGVLKPDIEKAKIWDFTAQKEDFAVGLNKATLQTLQRDTQIELVDRVLKPLTMTGSELSHHIHLDPRLNPAGRLEPAPGEVSGELEAMMLRELNLREFSPESLFGFRLPRWGTEKLYMPAPMVDALEKLESVRKSNLLAKSNKLFRYSILGLSPRYDAHVVFGGTMMLAMRSSPHVLNPSLLREAWRMMRERTLPMGLGHPVEEGVQLPDIAEATRHENQVLRTAHHRLGMDAGNMMIGEHIEQRQGISRYAAKPVHVLRALADLNFRFIRHVRDMQYSVAYLDGIAKAERKTGGRLEIEDPETGRMMHVTPERAVTEAMHHVQQVYGNLHRMSPFERQVAQTFMPFYGWQKHIIGFVLSFPFDHPYRALVLSQLAYNASSNVPLGFPMRLQFLMFLGAPDKNGNINAVDLRSLDPFRDVANYASWTGLFESLNPAAAAPLAMAFGPQAVYGESSLYPNVTYNAFYGIRTGASAGGGLVTGIEQFVPQVGAVQSALQAATGTRSMWNTNRPAAIKALLSAMNIPFVTPPVNKQQVAAKTEAARYETAKTDAQNAFSSGDFSKLRGYTTVPYPLNTAYQVTPAQLQQIYNQALQATPGVPPVESLLPPPTPFGW